MTVKLGHDIWEKTSTMALDRTAQTDQSGQVSLTEKPGQVSQNRIERWDDRT
jgi:hypothetical protein